MKKVLLLVLATVVSLAVSAQKISYDKVSDSGLRLIGCSSETFRSFSDKVVLSLSMSATVKDGDVNYFIDAALQSSDPISAPANARMLIKTHKGTVLTLEGFAPQTTADNIGEVKSVSGIVVKTFTINLPYNVSQEDIDTLSSEGVAKIRIELDGDKPYEKEWKKDKIGSFLAKEFNLLKGASATDKRGSFEDDF